MASYFEDLPIVFNNALKTFCDAKGLACAPENIDAPTSTATPYLASFVLLAPAEQADLGFTERRDGIFRLTSITPPLAGRTQLTRPPTS